MLATSTCSYLRRKPVSSKRASKAALLGGIKGAGNMLGVLAINSATKALLSSS